MGEHLAATNYWPSLAWRNCQPLAAARGGGMGEEGGREKGGANEQLEASSIVGPLAYSLANRQLPPTAASGQSCLGADQWLRLP